MFRLFRLFGNMGGMAYLQDNEIASTAATAREALQKINRVLSDTSTNKGVKVVVEQSDEVIRLPREVATVLREILVNSVAGRSVSVIPMRAELTTQQAANLLNVSRPHVIKLMDDGILRLPSFSGHPICTDLVSVGEDVHCESTAQEVHAGVPA